MVISDVSRDTAEWLMRAEGDADCGFKCRMFVLCPWGPLRGSVVHATFLLLGQTHD